MASTSGYHTTPNGTTIYFTETGNPDGTLMVLLHGLGGSTETFMPLLPHLHPKVYRIVCIDLEGFGKTPLSSPTVTLSIARYVDDLESLVASLQDIAKRGLVLIGHSMGGVIATHYAARHPEQLRGLALLGTGRSIASIPAARERMLGLAAKVRAEGIGAAADTAALSNFPTMGKVDPKLRDIVREAVAKTDVEGYAKACEAIASLDHVDPDYGRISAPTLLMAGSGDAISPPERSYGVEELIGNNAWVTVLERVGHQMILQELEGSVKAFEAFFDKLREA
ncbi:Alpha/Beta hydrolase protein [Aspergillus multicolor]|uniref:alpha/beta fold hydrolase n=1 Tax=Aspergillus multicolor TaxID=41759 RepID=UPI003CCCD0C1